MGEKLHVDAPDRQLELVEPDCGAAAGIDEKLLVAGLDQRAGSEAVGARDRRAGPEQGYLEIAPAHHCCIFIPEASTTLAQWASCELTSWP